MRPGRIRLVLVDDHEVVRAGLRAVLSRESDIEVVGEARDAEEAIEVVSSARPDIVILDYRLPGMDGLAFCREIAEKRFEAAVVVLSGHLNEEYVQGSFLAGARAYVVKDVDPGELKRAVRTVARGGTHVDPKVAGRLMGWASRLDIRTLDSLRPTEIAILIEIAKGKTNGEIADALGLSRHTISARLVVIYRKLGVHQRAEAIAVAMRRGLIPADVRSRRGRVPARQARSAIDPGPIEPSAQEAALLD